MHFPTNTDPRVGRPIAFAKARGPDDAHSAIVRSNADELGYSIKEKVPSRIATLVSFHVMTDLEQGLSMKLTQSVVLMFSAKFT